MSKTLYLVLAGAPASEESAELVRTFQGQYWRGAVLSTPTGVRFHDQERSEMLTGEPVRVDFRKPGTGKSFPPLTLSWHAR